MVRIAAALVAAGLLPALAGASPAKSGADAFRMPSGNIYCAYEHYSFAPIDLRCEIRTGISPLPPRPKSCGDAVWGAGYSIRRTGPAHVLCISDTVYDPKARVLRYGTTRRFGVFTCSSGTAGLRCTNASGHGFFVSREHSYAFTRQTARNGTFKTPSGNIVCGYGNDPAYGASIECGIESGLKPPPAPIHCSAGDPTHKRVSLRGTGRAIPVLCAGDPGPLLPEIRARARVLAYGSALRIGSISCVSETTGLTCSNAGGHGFFLSRDSWRSF
jgi:Family of unknown function (DUF6636)